MFESGHWDDWRCHCLLWSGSRTIYHQTGWVMNFRGFVSVLLILFAYGFHYSISSSKTRVRPFKGEKKKPILFRFVVKGRRRRLSCTPFSPPCSSPLVQTCHRGRHGRCMKFPHACFFQSSTLISMHESWCDSACARHLWNLTRLPVCIIGDLLPFARRLRQLWIAVQTRLLITTIICTA